MQDDVKLEICPLRWPLFINKNPVRENFPQNNHKNVSQPMELNKNTDTSNTYPM